MPPSPPPSDDDHLVRLTAFPFKNDTKHGGRVPVWYGIPPHTLSPNSITLLNTGGTYYPNKWVDRACGTYQYFLDRTECAGNAILRKGVEREVRVFIYERNHMFCVFIGEFRVTTLSADPQRREYVQLKRVAMPAEVDSAWAAYHQTLLVEDRPMLRSASEQKHLDVLRGLASRVTHEEMSFPRVSYVWNGVQKLSDSNPDFFVYDDDHPDRFMLVESKHDPRCRETEENVEKLRALSRVLPPLFRCVLMCGHGASMEITEYVNGEAVELTLDTLMSGVASGGVGQRKRGLDGFSEAHFVKRFRDSTADK
jgi:hypothetical protein